MEDLHITSIAEGLFTRSIPDVAEFKHNLEHYFKCRISLKSNLTFETEDRINNI
jgi:hypothetical protein